MKVRRSSVSASAEGCPRRKARKRWSRDSPSTMIHSLFLSSRYSLNIFSCQCGRPHLFDRKPIEPNILSNPSNRIRFVSDRFRIIFVNFFGPFLDGFRIVLDPNFPDFSIYRFLDPQIQGCHLVIFGRGGSKHQRLHCGMAQSGGNDGNTCPISKHIVGHHKKNVYSRKSDHTCTFETCAVANLN